LVISCGFSPVVIATDLATLSDEFDDVGSLIHWSRIHQTEGWSNNVLETFDANTTRPGQLVMMPYTSVWFDEWRGELTYKTVTGNFAVTTFVEPRNRAGLGRPEQDYSLAGIMVRVPRAMTNAAQWTPNGQNYIFLSMGAANRTTALYQFEVKTTVNSTSTLFVTDTSATRAAIQVARLGPYLIALRREEGQSWAVHRRYFRPDFPELVQAGLTVYTDWNTCSAVGPENNNRLVLTNGATLLDNSTLSGASPDLIATFDYVRFARITMPPAWVGADLMNEAEVSDAALLTYLGESLNVPGGAVVPAEFIPSTDAPDVFRAAANVVSQRSYRVQTADAVQGPWLDAWGFVSTNTTVSWEYPIGEAELETYFRLVSP
jgi:hypothetical protein